MCGFHGRHFEDRTPSGRLIFIKDSSIEFSELLLISILNKMIREIFIMRWIFWESDITVIHPIWILPNDKWKRIKNNFVKFYSLIYIIFMQEDISKYTMLDGSLLSVFFYLLHLCLVYYSQMKYHFFLEHIS